MAATIAAMSGVPVATLAAGSTTGTGVAINIPHSSQDTNFYIKGTGTISAGTLYIEEADSPDYAGTWSLIDDVDLTGVTAGAMIVMHVAGMLRAVRARFSVAASGGGSISCDVVCA